MRVLFTSSPGWGHVHPMVPLGQAFVERGDTVMWAASSEVCPRLEHEGFKAVPAGLTEPEAHQLLTERFREIMSLRPPPPMAFAVHFGVVKAPPMLTDLMPIAADFRPDLVVHEAGELAAPLVAASIRVPNITHGIGELVFTEDRLAAAVEQVAPLWTSMGLEPRPYAGCYDDLYLDIFPLSLQVGERSRVAVVQPIRPVPFATAGSEDLPTSVIDGDEKPLIYFTLGTVFNGDIPFLLTVVDGLAALPVRVLVTVGPKGDPGSLGTMPANVHVARYVPQTQILPHADLVVSHAGSGTFLASLGHGIPQLCLPQGADQFANASAAERRGVGLSIGPGLVTSEAVREAAGRLLQEPQFRDNARSVEQEISEMPGPSSVADIIGSLVEQWSPRT